MGRVGLGAMPLSVDGRPTEAEAVRVIHAALDAGMTLIDTADVYCLDDADIGHNERLIAKALKSRRAGGVVVATKGGLRRPRGAWTSDASPKSLRRACEASLKALGTDAIGLYQLHAPDENVPFMETLAALADLKKEGKVLHVGLSNVGAGHVELAEKFFPVASVQNRCNIFDRASVKDGTLALCEKRGIAFLPYSPVGGRRRHAALMKDPALREQARRLGATPYQVALAWLLKTSPACIPIPGASRPESARSSAAASDLELDRAAMAALDRLSDGD